ncbi:MAG: sel1 repeat family protein, partial [Halomonas sp.]|uniref:tetratricopeptide repeat protein n=1 Tax=Halomonas sp. TaxID=1486246 RepID=UPI001A0D716F|nr:sel1 repeat family protein [Halomonas sp.]
PLSTPSRLTASLALLALLSGCGSPGLSTGTAQPQAEVPAEYRDWFGWRPEANIGGDDWQQINRAQEFIEQGRHAEAIERLEPLVARNIPPAYYEMAKLHDDGLGVERDPAEAARLYGRAIEWPSPIRGQASLNLAELYLAGDGVERNERLAFHLLDQAVKEGVERAEPTLAGLLAEGGEQIGPDPERAQRLYERAAQRGDANALEALAEAHGPNGWRETAPEHAMDYGKRLEAVLEEQAAGGDTGAMRRLAGLYAPDGLLGDQPERRQAWLVRAADAGDVDALGHAGTALLRGGDPQRGLALLEEAAERGDVDAMTRLGQALLDPDVGPARPAQAKRWLEAAVEAGDVDARVILGSALIDEAREQAGLMGLDGSGDDPATTLATNALATPPEVRRGIALLEEGAEQDDPLALAHLGSLYLDDELVPSQPWLAVNYLERGHELGHPWATQQLGAAHLEGRGVPVDGRRAEELLREAAEQGQEGALRLLGDAYLDGEVVPLHPSRGEALLEEAAEAGDTAAMTSLGEAYLTGPLEEQPQRGRALLEQAARQGDAYAMVVLGRAYREGRGVPRDLDEATRWLSSARDAGHASADEAMVGVNRERGAQGDINALIAAAEEGHPGAMADLGRAFRDGAGVQANPEAARAWLERAANAGHTGARAEVGEMLLESDPERGLTLLRSAADAGHDGARLRLGEALLLGEHVEADTEQGVATLRPAAEAGNPHAARLLGQAYLEGNGVAADPAQAREWLDLAVESGDLSSRANLGRILLRGEAGMPEDIERGQALLQEAAEEGHAGAQATLGREYLRGERLARDTRRGADYLLQAARQGHSSARLALAEAYLEANGLQSANREQALLWLEEVMEADSDMALETLHELIADDIAAAR